jgi:hypothetical protein
MTRRLLPSVQNIFRNLNEIGAVVVHSSKQPLDAGHDIGKTLEYKEEG